MATTWDVQRLDELLSDTRARVRHPAIARAFWRSIDDEQRRHLESLEETLPNAPAFYRALRGCSPDRAAVELAFDFDLLRKADYRALLRHLGAVGDVDLVEDAISQGKLVLQEAEESVHWEGERIAIDWGHSEWRCLWMLAVRAKQGRPLYPGQLQIGGRTPDGKILVRLKSRLKATSVFPRSLQDRIRSVRPRGQQLDLEPAAVRLFRCRESYEVVEVLE